MGHDFKKLALWGFGILVLVVFVGGVLLYGG